VGNIKETMQLDRAGILLIDRGDNIIKYKIAKVVGFDKANGISLVRDNFLTRYLQQTQKPLVRDEIQMIAEDSSSKNDRRQFFRLAENMKRIEASLCLPMLISGKPIGMIVLGGKNSGDAYTSDDLNLLNTLAKQASVAINNARLYQEVRDFNKTLEEKVSEQTKKIRGQKEQLQESLEVEKQAHAIERRANEELRKIDESKSDFMTITQHHLRTPLSTNAGIVDLMLSGAFGKMPEKMEKVILRLKESNQKGIDVVNELLDVSSYQMGKEVIHLDKESIFPPSWKKRLKTCAPRRNARGFI
jgi:signal transduction histidine kinase